MHTVPPILMIQHFQFHMVFQIWQYGIFLSNKFERKIIFEKKVSTI